MVTRLEALAQLTAPGEPYELVTETVFGAPCRVFKNAPPTLRDLYETTRSDLTFFIYEDERLTFEQTWRRACTLAAALVDDYGVQNGDRVAISMRNYPEWVIGFMAATSIGAIAVAMNALWQPIELAFGLKDCGAKVLLADQERLDRLAQIEGGAPSDLAIIAVRATKPLPAGARPYTEVMARTERNTMPALADFGPNDPAIMLYTSGSTGNPKGVVSTHRNVISALLSWELDAKAAVATGMMAAPVEGAPQTATLLGIPLFHVTGLHTILLSSLRLQRRCISMYKWDAALAAQIIETERVTNFTGPPAVTGDLVEEAKRTNRDLSSLVAVGGGGATRAPDQVRAIDSVFTNAKPATGWGMTETNAIGAGIGLQDYVDRPESSGRASAVLDLRVVDPEGNTLPANQRGELQVRGTSIVKGYWNRPDADAEAFTAKGWFRTGDVALIDDEGFVFIVDRIKDMVIRGGENIGCGPVESALLEHPDVIEACVYGVPDHRLGEEVGATIHALEPIDHDALRAFLEPRLAKFQIPRYLHVEPAPLPRIATGKIFKRQLKAEAAARLIGG
ncbi:class I adenylate-forming enzyme family protein [soil metagenome]